MYMETRASPEFAYDWQKDLYFARKQFAMLVNFPFNDDGEAAYIGALTAEEANDLLVEINARRKTFEKKSAKKKGKGKTAEGTADPPETTASQQLQGSNDAEEIKPDPEQSGEPEASSSKPLGAKSTRETSEVDPSDPSDPSSSDDDSNDGDPRRRISREDKERVRGRTPRIEGGKTTKKLFKMDAPRKYSGEKEDERTYEAVHLFLSQLSRYLRLATYIEMDRDVSEYVLGFLDGFAYRWFETLDKGTTSFRWKEFETAFRKKFIPREHVQIAVTKYLAIKQHNRTVQEYIVEREGMENTLGEVIGKALKESSFREGLNRSMRDKMELFRELDFEKYKEKCKKLGYKSAFLRFCGREILGI